MILFNAIAAAAVIGTSFVAATPAEARNGWILVARSTDGRGHYIRNVKSMGSGIYRYEDDLNNIVEAKCNGEYVYKRLVILNVNGKPNVVMKNKAWKEPRPGTIGMAEAEAACGLR